MLSITGNKNPGAVLLHRKSTPGSVLPAFAVNIFAGLGNAHINIAVKAGIVMRGISQTVRLAVVVFQNLVPLLHQRERLIPWYSVLEVWVDSTCRLFEILLSSGTVFRIISRKPQEELYANFQLERVKVIYPVEGVAIHFDGSHEKRPVPDGEEEQ